MQKNTWFFCLIWKGCKADKLVLNALDEVECQEIYVVSVILLSVFCLIVF